MSDPIDPITKVDAGALFVPFPSACVFQLAKVYPGFVRVPLPRTVTVAPVIYLLLSAGGSPLPPFAL